MNSTCRRGGLAGVTVGLLLATVGCGAEPGPHGTASAGSPSSSAGSKAKLGPVKVDYAYSELIDGEESRMEWEIITDGEHRIRWTLVGGFNADGPAIGTYSVWDGTTLLTYAPDDTMPYQRTNHPTADEMPAGPMVARPGSAAFDQLCPAAERTGTRTLLGRPAVVYTCHPSPNADDELPATELQVDEATGLVLKIPWPGGGLRVTDLELDPKITAATFSTALPPGVSEFEPFSFRLPRVGGGQLTTTDYVGQPLLVVTGDAAGIRAMVARLKPLTDLPILGLLIAVPSPDWKGTLLKAADRRSLAAQISREAGSFPVPVAIDFKGEAAGPISGRAGVPERGTRPTAVGFVRSDQGLAKVLTEDASDASLRAAIAKLR